MAIVIVLIILPFYIIHKKKMLFLLGFFYQFKAIMTLRQKCLLGVKENETTLRVTGNPRFINFIT